MATVQIRKTGVYERVAHTLLLLAAASLIVTINVVTLRLYPEVHAGVLKADALIDFSARTMVDVKKLVKDADDTENAQASYLKQWNEQVTVALGRTNALLGHADDSVQAFTANQNDVTQHVTVALDAATSTIKSVQPAVASLQDLIQSLDESTKQLTTTEVTVNKYLPVIMGDAQDIAESSKSTSSDIAHAVHSYVYPRPIVDVVNWTLKIGGAIGNWFHF